MTLAYDFKFVSLYWQYIVAGIVCYISARFFYTVLGSKYNQTYGDRKGDNDEDIGFEDQKLKDDSSEDKECEDLDCKSIWAPPNLKHVPLVYEKFPEKEMIDRASEFYKFMNMRRTVRQFSQQAIPIEVIRNIIRTAGTAPSGAHAEPWTYVIVSDVTKKAKIRQIIEQEEEVNYMQSVGKIKTPANCMKEYLTDAPYLIFVFKQVYSIAENGKKRINYYNEMSVNIAVGMLLTAIHYAGLVSLTSKPLNCGPAIRLLLGRPNNEKLIILLPVGYPAVNCKVPDLERKSLDEILVEV